MYRCAASRLTALKGQGSTKYSTSVATRPASSKGFFSWLTGESSAAIRARDIRPLDFPIPGVAAAPPLPDFVEPGKTKITTLPNGLKIASETSPNDEKFGFLRLLEQNPAASIGLYVDCGSNHESPVSFGASHLLERMAFKTTLNRSHLRIVREVEAIGGNVMASASREQMGYTYDALKTYVPEMLEVLIDCVRNPAFLDWEVNEQLQKVKAEIAEANNNPQGLMMEAIHAAGYAGALANPLLAPESAISRLNSTILEEFVAVRTGNLLSFARFCAARDIENYTAPRMVLAASGVDHEEFLSIAEPLLSDLPGGHRPSEPETHYVGGDFRRQADSPDTHIGLAFELPGGWHNDKDAMTLTVLQIFASLTNIKLCNHFQHLAAYTTTLVFLASMPQLWGAGTDEDLPDPNVIMSKTEKQP
ncbi:hypothetical protein Scep_008145 [Stephania cephalantha]|uniref:Mitochondrial-processing peptidase subunit alpha n=1 Tax=Stephania cephalantha TaxID=152367 RepID=A0AAP0KCW8_9MAGN